MVPAAAIPRALKEMTLIQTNSVFAAIPDMIPLRTTGRSSAALSETVAHATGLGRRCHKERIPHRMTFPSVQATPPGRFTQLPASVTIADYGLSR